MLNWEYKKFDEGRNYFEDLEIAPFFDGYYNINGNIIDHPRFGNMSKTSKSYNTSRFACYLHNIYDGFGDTNFTNPRYMDYDIDNVSGYGGQVFDLFEFYTKNYYEFYNDIPPYKDTLDVPYGFNLFLKNFLGTTETIKCYIQQIYDFMEFDNLSLTKTTNAIMQPPQVINISKVFDNNNVIINFKSRTYPNIIGINSHVYTEPGVRFEGSYNFCNNEEGVYLYKKIDGNWLIYETKLYNSTNPNYTFILPNVETIYYKLTVFKDYVNCEWQPLIFSTPISKKGLDITKTQDFMIFPNPVNDLLNIKFYLDKEINLSFEVVNLVGKILISRNIPCVQGDNFHTIDLSNLEYSQNYILRIIDKLNNKINNSQSFFLYK